MPFWLEVLLPFLAGVLAGESLVRAILLLFRPRPSTYVDPGHPDRASGGGW